MAAKGTRSRKKTTIEPGSRGLTPAQAAQGAAPARIEELRAAVEGDGGRVLAAYRDPLGGRWGLLAVLPLDQVQPTPYQRDLSEPHVARLAERIDQIDRYLDPIIAYRKEDRRYWTPNGHHRTAAMRRLGAKAITALVLPDEEIAFKILALNTEKAHVLREKALEVVRMARALAGLDPRPERDFAVEFEDPVLLTLGLCYEQRGRFPGSVFQPVLRRVEAFLGQELPKALEVRAARAARLLELDDEVGRIVSELKARGLDSPYLKAFVVARINPLRFQRPGGPGGTGAQGAQGAQGRSEKADFDETIEKMLAKARRFDAAKVNADHVSRAGGPPEE